MPGPPPYGRSSTVRYLSAVKSRGFHVVSEYRPASSARLVMPLPVIAANISGNSVTTSKRITSPLPTPRRSAFSANQPFSPLQGSTAAAALAVPRHLHHVLRAVEHPALHCPEHDSLLVHHLEAHEVREVVVPASGFGSASRGTYTVEPFSLRRFAVLQPAELREQRARVLLHLLDGVLRSADPPGRARGSAACAAPP